MTTLEQHYRRLIRYLPKDYREARAEEILTTLMDDAEPGRRRPKMADMLSVGSLAVRLRFGAPGASARGRLTGDIARKAIIANLVLQSAASAYVLSLLVIYFRPIYSMVSEVMWFGSAVCVSDAVLAAALILGLRRTGRVLSVVTLVIVTVETVFFALPVHIGGAQDGFPAYYGFTAVAWVLQSITALGVFPAFHQHAPRLAGRRWWLLSSLVLFAFGLFLGGFSSLVFAAAGAVATVVAASRAESSPIWSLAFLLGAWPLLMTGLETVVDPAQYLGPDGYFDTAVSFSVVGVLLFLTLTSMAFRSRRIPA